MRTESVWEKGGWGDVRPSLSSGEEEFFQTDKQSSLMICRLIRDHHDHVHESWSFPLNLCYFNQVEKRVNRSRVNFSHWRLFQRNSSLMDVVFQNWNSLLVDHSFASRTIHHFRSWSSCYKLYKRRHANIRKGVNKWIAIPHDMQTGDDDLRLSHRLSEMLI